MLYCTKIILKKIYKPTGHNERDKFKLYLKMKYNIL